MGCRLCLLCMAVALLLPLPGMSFCRAPQPRLVCGEYFASQFIVEATLVRTDKDDPVTPSSFIYTLRVKRTLRGEVPGTIRVYEENSSGSATFGWVPGRDYLLFLSYAANDHTLWELDGCGNSGPLRGADKALSEIAAIKAARGGGIIHGVLRGRDQLPETGVRVEAQGTTGRYAATTNKDGKFQINVPAGRYVVRASTNDSFFDMDDSEPVAA